MQKILIKKTEQIRMRYKRSMLIRVSLLLVKSRRKVKKGKKMICFNITYQFVTKTKNIFIIKLYKIKLTNK